MMQLMYRWMSSSDLSSAVVSSKSAQQSLLYSYVYYCDSCHWKYSSHISVELCLVDNNKTGTSNVVSNQLLDLDLFSP